jgi:hypothetical protein
LNRIAFEAPEYVTPLDAGVWVETPSCSAMRVADSLPHRVPTRVHGVHDRLAQGFGVRGST